MKPWIFYALASMFFAGFTSVIAKLGLTGISSELGLAIRSAGVFALVMAFAAVTVPREQIAALTRTNVLWLGLSSLTTTLSWIFYYRAIKEGDVSTVAIIDKGSMVVAVALAALILKEQITVRTLAGGALVIVGLAVIVRR